MYDAARAMHMSGGEATWSEIEFGTDGWRAAGESFTLDRVRAIGQAVATYLESAGTDRPVAVGYDARETSREAAEQLARVLAANGYDVQISTRDCPTPVLAWTVSDGPFAGGLMVTASHNPPEYNGVKYVVEDGSPALPPVTDALEANLATPSAVDEADHGTVHERDFIAGYLDHAEAFVEQTVGDSSLGGLSIVYDAMYGSGRGVTDRLLERTDADVSRLRCERDTSFGGISPEPRPENAETILTRIEDGDASLGLINDGDADRLGVITPRRGFLDPNVLLALIYQFLLDQTDGGDAVRTVSTSSLIDRVAHEAGRHVHETAVGFKWVAAAMADHDALAGGEESGGYGIARHLHNKDGVLLALLLAAAHRRQPLDDRIDALFEEYGQIVQDRRSVDCPDEQKGAVLDALDDAVPTTIAGTAVADVLTVDGFKLTLEDGSWVLVRPSGTEPKLRVYAEAESQERAEELLAAGERLVSQFVE